MADDEQPYVDPNSGLASQPGSYAHNGLSDEEPDEDPNPDPGGAEAVFGDPKDAVQNAAIEHGATPDPGLSKDEGDDEGDEGDEDDEDEDPNPDPGGAEAELADGSEAVHDHAVETQAAAPLEGEPAPDEDPNPDPGGAEVVLAEGNTRVPQDAEVTEVEEPGKNASRAAWVEFAKTKGASEEELGDDGLKRDELAEKYGSA